jgi:hypothetical protein
LFLISSFFDRVSSAAQRRVIIYLGSSSINQQPCLIIFIIYPSFLPFFPYSPTFFLERFGISFDGRRRGGGMVDQSINQLSLKSKSVSPIRPPFVPSASCWAQHVEMRLNDTTA